MDRISSIPFPASLAAQAYGVRPPARAPKPEQAAPVEPIARIGRDETPRPDADPTRLVAARVGPIDLARDVAQIAGQPERSGSYALYRHPADRNQAATAVALGRSLDVKG